MGRPVKQRTLCLVLDESQQRILLDMKASERFGGGKWNGPGGKMEGSDKDLVACAVRELMEEAHLYALPENLRKVGKFDFYFPLERSGWNQTVHVYSVGRYRGEVVHSDEMAWKWFLIDDIPYHEMWGADRIWLPRVLEGEVLEGEFEYDENKEVVHSSLWNLENDTF